MKFLCSCTWRYYNDEEKSLEDFGRIEWLKRMDSVYGSSQKVSLLPKCLRGAVEIPF